MANGVTKPLPPLTPPTGPNELTGALQAPEPVVLGGGVDVSGASPQLRALAEQNRPQSEDLVSSQLGQFALSPQLQQSLDVQRRAIDQVFGTQERRGRQALTALAQRQQREADKSAARRGIAGSGLARRSTQGIQQRQAEQVRELLADVGGGRATALGGIEQFQTKLLADATARQDAFDNQIKALLFQERLRSKAAKKARRDKRRGQLIGALASFAGLGIGALAGNAALGASLGGIAGSAAGGSGFNPASVAQLGGLVQGSQQPVATTAGTPEFDAAAAGQLAIDQQPLAQVSPMVSQDPSQLSEMDRIMLARLQQQVTLPSAVPNVFGANTAPIAPAGDNAALNQLIQQAALQPRAL